MATVDELKKQMEANSAAWHTADDATKKQLEQANKDLASQIGGMSFNSAAGTWSSGSGSSGNSSYQNLNSTSAAGINRQNFDTQVANQQAYVANNPSAVKAYTQEEKQSLYGNITDPIWNTGVYTTDKEGAYAAGAQWGIEVTPTDYSGKSGYYYVPDVKDQRTVQQGASGADEGLMNNQDYAIIQSLKQDFADAQSGYNAAVAAGDTELAAQYQAAMDNAHLEAERIRAGYGYSGGQDGSMHITHGKLGVSNEDDSASGYGYSDSSGSSGGSSSSGSGTVTDLSQWLEAMYNAKTEAALAELEAAYKQNVASLDRAEVGLQEAYQDNRNQTAGASELAARNFAEYANAHGLNSGTGGQAELARNVTLQNNMNDINMQESQSLADLDLARANAETEYNLAIAQAQATGDYELAASLYQEKVRVQEALTQLMMWETEVALQQQQMDISNSQWQQQFAFNQQQYADSLALQQQQLAAQEQAAYNELYAAAYGNEALFNTLYGTGGTNVGSTSTPVTSIPVTATPVSTASNVNYNNGSLTNSQVKQLQNYYGLTADGFWGPNSQSSTGLSADQAWAKYQAASKSEPANNSFSSLHEAFATGHPEKALERLDAIWGTLTDEQKAAAKAVAYSYGYEYTP